MFGFAALGFDCFDDVGNLVGDFAWKVGKIEKDAKMLIFRGI